MANRNSAGFGLIAQGTIGSTPSTGGQGKYYIDAAYNADLFQGSAVQSKVGYIKTAQPHRDTQRDNFSHPATRHHLT